jgi:hypothetical protein
MGVNTAIRKIRQVLGDSPETPTISFRDTSSRRRCKEDTGDTDPPGAFECSRLGVGRIRLGAGVLRQSEVTALTDCVSQVPLTSFTALLTSARGGTMTGTTANPAFAIGQRSPDHGVWFRSRAAHGYRSSSVALLLFGTSPNFPATPRFQAGSQRLSQAIDVTDPDHFTSEAVSEFFDGGGNKYREGCATAVGQRFE